MSKDYIASPFHYCTSPELRDPAGFENVPGINVCISENVIVFILF